MQPQPVTTACLCLSSLIHFAWKLSQNYGTLQKSYLDDNINSYPLIYEKLFKAEDISILYKLDNY